MNKVVRIGTRDSELAVWQASLVKEKLAAQHIPAELVFIKSEGDIDLVTPLYDIGVQGIFTKTLDAALLNNRIDIAVHSMKDVPVQLAKGIVQAAVLERGSYKDILVYKEGTSLLTTHQLPCIIATSSIRRKAQWLHKYPGSIIENLRGNVNTRLRKLNESNWHGAIFAAAGLERIGLRPAHSIDLDWMLPAPAQGAIVVVCGEKDIAIQEYCRAFNDRYTEICTKIEKDFLKALMGGCSVPISALAEIKNDTVFFRGNIFSPDGTKYIEVERAGEIKTSKDIGIMAAKEIIEKGGASILEEIRNGTK